MKITLRNLGWLSVGGILLMAVACASPQPAARSAPSPAVHTPIPTTKLPAAQARIPTPTPVPAQVIQITADFATGHNSVAQTWDQSHRDFDQWRQGLIACDASSVEVALHDFTGRFAGITETARALPRASAVRKLSDQLIQAAEQEEEALRLLRDTWQPEMSETSNGADSDQDDTRNGLLADGPATVFEEVALARSSSSALLKEVSDQLSDLQANTSVDAQSRVNQFSAAVQDLNTAWDQFHGDYDSFRSSEGVGTSTQTVSGLGRLVGQFRGVVEAARDLPSAPGTGQVSQLLAESAENEDLALRLLRGTFQKSDETASDSFGELEEPLGDGRSRNGSSGSSGSSNEDSPAAFVASDPTLFDEFDAQLVEANAARRRAGQQLAQARGSVSDDARAAVEGFAGRHQLVVTELNNFHREYDKWRSTEGGCDRTKAIEALGEFAIKSAELISKVRDLPRATFLRPMGELLVEAAQREEDALRELRHTWRPFDAKVYQTLDRQRDTAGKLRRQVSLGIQELVELYGIDLSGS